MKKMMVMTFISICICFVPLTGLACTTFVLDNNGQPVYGKNMDYAPMSAYVIVNKRGVTKTTIPPAPDPVATWTSKFGSITFTFYARECPFDGINEAGLFISTMGLPQTEYPESDSRPGMGELKWVQYQLDNFSTVDEVIASDKDVRIYPGQGLHFLVRDSQGNSAIIEWLGGEMVVHTGETMPVKVLANTTYDQSLKTLSHFQGFGGFLPTSLSNILIKCIRRPLITSPFRFVTAADMVEQFEPQTSKPIVDYAFDILSSVAEPEFSRGPTLWSVVYDLPNSTVYFRTINNDKVRSFNLYSFDFSCTTPVKALDVNAELEGDVTGSFVDYTEDMSRGMLKSLARNNPEWNITNELIDLFATYPEKYTHCTE
jgi:penicillin V acylase-like amidase (Ntn superfamily)